MFFIIFFFCDNRFRRSPVGVHIERGAGNISDSPGNNRTRYNAFCFLYVYFKKYNVLLLRGNDLFLQ